MLRSYVNIGNSKFMLELYKYGDEFSIEHEFNLVVDYDSITRVPSGFLFINSDNNSIFPVSETSYNTFSSSINDFTTYAKKYDIINSENNKIHLCCDIVRIYHPINRKNNSDLICCIDTVFNDTSVILSVDKYNKYKLGSVGDIEYYGEHYSEYIEILIPNISFLLSGMPRYADSRVKIDIKNTNKSSTVILNDKPNEVTQNIPVSIMNMICSVNGDGSILYTDSCDKYSNAITVTLCPVEKTKDRDRFVNSNSILSSSNVFQQNSTIYLTSKFGFRKTDGKCVYKGKFIYPTELGFTDIEQAYQYYNNVSFADYDNIYYDEGDDNYNETENHQMYQIVYQVEIASDVTFNSILYKSELIPNITLKNTVTDIEFEMPKLLSDINKLPPTISIRIKFIDRYLGKVLYSNFTLIGPEILKYFSINDEKYKIDFTRMNNTEFIDKITCNMISSKSNLETPNNMPSISNTIIYKPIFYKTYPSQDILIYDNLVQNIGINLSQYLSKVESFKIRIDGMEMLEIGRNGNFVVFKLEIPKMQRTSGVYHIFNQDSEYITSGNWSLQK